MKKIVLICMCLFAFAAVYSQTAYREINEVLEDYEGVDSIEAITSLLEDGLEATDSSGWTALILAADRGSPRISRSFDCRGCRCKCCRHRRLDSFNDGS